MVYRIFVLVDDGGSSTFQIGGSPLSHSSRLSRSSKIRVFNFGGSSERDSLSLRNVDSSNFSLTATFSSNGWYIQHWDTRKLNEDTFDVVGILRRETEGNKYEHAVANWEYKVQLDESNKGTTGLAKNSSAAPGLF